MQISPIQKICSLCATGNLIFESRKMHQTPFPAAHHNSGLEAVLFFPFTVKYGNWVKNLLFTEDYCFYIAFVFIKKTIKYI